MAKELNRRAGVYKGLPTNTIAAISELSVGADLLKKGYYVFRALSMASYCDLIAIKENKIYQVEVRTGYKSIDGKLFYPILLRKTANLYAVWERNSQEITYLDDKRQIVKI